MNALLVHLRETVRSITRLGWEVVLLGGLAWFAARQFGWEETALLAGVCASVLGAAVPFTFGRTSLDVSLQLDPRRVRVGGHATCTVRGRNTSARWTGSTRLEIPVGQGVARVSLPSLGRDALAEESFVIPATKRCVVQVGPVTSVRGDPLGLARREVTWTDSIELVIHPDYVDVPGITAGWIRDLEGRETSELSTSDVAFHALRDYEWGDDPRHIHWLTTARLGRYVVRQYVDTKRAHLGILLPTESGAFAHEAEFELAISIAASLGASAIRDGNEVTCVAGRERLPAHAGQPFLDALAALEGERLGFVPAERVRHVMRVMKRSSVVILLAGSVVTPEALRQAASHVPVEARAVAIRVEPGASLRRIAAGPRSVFTMGHLDDVNRVMRSLATT